MRERARLRLSLEGRDVMRTPFVLRHALSTSTCAALIRAAERVGARRGWQSKRHANYPTVDIPLHDLSHVRYASLCRFLDGVALPQLQHQYATRPLRVREAFVVKYEAAGGKGAPEAVSELDASAQPREGGGGARSVAPAPRQAGLALHRDGTLLNVIVLLSEQSDFEGGGTVFAPPLDTTYRTERGDCLCSSGQLLHGAKAVTRGRRYVLIAFVDELQEEAMEEVG